MQYCNSHSIICRKIRYFGKDSCKICDKIRRFQRNISEIHVKYGVWKLKKTQNTKKHAILSRFCDMGWSQDAGSRACRFGFRVFVFQMRLRARRPYSWDSQACDSKCITECAPEALRKVNFLLAHSQRIRPQWELRRLMHRWPRVNTSSDRWRVGGNLGFRV